MPLARSKDSTFICLNRWPTMCPVRYLSLFIILVLARLSGLSAALTEEGILCEVSRVVVHGSDACLMSVSLCLFASL